MTRGITPPGFTRETHTRSDLPYTVSSAKCIFFFTYERFTKSFKKTLGKLIKHFSAVEFAGNTEDASTKTNDGDKSAANTRPNWYTVNAPNDRAGPRTPVNIRNNVGNRRGETKAPPSEFQPNLCIRVWVPTYPLTVAVETRLPPPDYDCRAPRAASSLPPPGGGQMI